jgi:hypothetical protein
MMQALREFTEGRFTIEEIDQLTGTLIGHPRSATFRTADVVGLDTLQHVAENLYGAIPDDESREAFRSAGRPPAPGRGGPTWPEDARGLLQEGRQGHPLGRSGVARVHASGGVLAGPGRTEGRLARQPVVEAVRR